MAENPQNSINPIILPVESVETASRNFLVNDRKTLRVTKRTKIVFETLTKNALHFLSGFHSSTRPSNSKIIRSLWGVLVIY
jgi:hypothetical protein